MFRYVTSYRCYTLAKIGFGLAFFWYVWDFFWIHTALWHQLAPLIASSNNDDYSGEPVLETIGQRVTFLLNQKAVVGMFLVAAPVAVALFLWGRHKWLQFTVGSWISLTLICLSVNYFHSTADLWVNLVFLTYALTALMTPTEGWAQNEPGFSFGRWRSNPQFRSIFAWLVVLVQFSVYFFAGVNKLVDGWQPWTSGTAIQNLLAYDNSVHEFARGFRVPFWLSWTMCYVTLFQRLVVPFGFYFRRWRIWSALILGSMHIGYAILMYVNLFPLIGISSLLMVLPPSGAPTATPVPRRLPGKARKLKPAAQVTHPMTFAQHATALVFSVWLLTECVRLTSYPGLSWEETLLVEPDWRMFSDGGSLPAGDWQLILESPDEQLDATYMSRKPLPHLWRDRFYLNDIYYELIEGRAGMSGSLTEALVKTTEKAFMNQLGEPVSLRARFIVHEKTNTLTIEVPW